VHNGSGLLDGCLRSLARSTFRDYECIVIDDGSTDATPAVAARHGATLVALDQCGGPARARNRGAAQARGDILVFFDADVCVHPDTLDRIDAHFRAHPTTDALIGSYDAAPADSGFVSQYKNLFHHYVHQRSRTDAWTFWAGCGAVRREVFLRTRGFDEAYTRPCIEDIELGFRLRTAGHRIDLNPAIQVTHHKRWTLWNLVRTDLLDRAVPWFLLMLRTRTMPRDLNVTGSDRLSVALLSVMVLLACSALAGQWAGWGLSLPWAAGAVVTLASALFVLNRDLYRFFARQRGLLFAARAVPLHWLYCGCCGLAVAIGLCVHGWRTLLPRRTGATTRSIECQRQ
jgi:GT2 family glycosyltransferase